MNRFLRSRLCRCCVCLILVLVLLISWSPIKAKAVVTEEAIGVAIYEAGLYAQAGAVSAGAAAFCWVLAGLIGVISVAKAIDLMNQYVEYSNELEVSLYYYPDGSWSYGVDMGFVERVRAFLWGEGILQSVNFVDCIPDNFAYENNFSIAYRTACESPFACLMTWPEGSGIAWSLYISDSGFNLTTIDGYSAIISGSAISRCDYSSTIFRPLSSNYVKYGSDVSVQMFTGALTSISSSYGSIGIVAPPEVDVPLGYPEWHTNARPATNPDTEEEITVLPIPLDPNIQELPDTLTQPDTWQGSIADPMPDAGTDTDDPDSGSNDPTTPTTGTDTDPDRQPDTPGAPSTDIGKYQIDLKDFFPFCIPFDLYRFFEILCAEPEAPVFHWEFNVFGELHSLDVDLSPWNPHAQLFRDAQVGLFIMGLLWITRKFIKW